MALPENDQGPKKQPDEATPRHRDSTDNGKGKAPDRRQSNGESSSKHDSRNPRPRSSRSLDAGSDRQSGSANERERERRSSRTGNSNSHTRHPASQYQTPPESTQSNGSSHTSSPPLTQIPHSRPADSRRGSIQSGKDLPRISRRESNQPVPSRRESSHGESSRRARNDRQQPQTPKPSQRDSSRTQSRQGANADSQGTVAKPPGKYLPHATVDYSDFEADYEAVVKEATTSPPRLELPSAVKDDPESRAKARAEKWERTQTRETIKQFLQDGSLSVNQVIKNIERLVTTARLAEQDAAVMVKQLEGELQSTKRQADELYRNVNQSWDDVIHREERIQLLEDKLREMDAENRQLHDEVGTSVKAAVKAEVAAEQKKMRDRIEATLTKEKKTREKLNERNMMVNDLQSKMAQANQAIDHYRSQLARAEKDSTGWGENIERWIMSIAEENVMLRRNVKMINDFMSANRFADATRFDEVKHQPRLIRPAQEPPTMPTTLTSGTIDRDMTDVFTTDTDMSNRPNLYESPALIKVRRRLGRPKVRARRAGSALPDLKTRFREQRAVSSYLQYKDERNEVDDIFFHTKGHHKSLCNAYPRKRNRLSIASDLTKRIETATTEVKLPILKLRDLANPKPRVGLTVYDRRNDKHMAEMLEKFNLSDEPEDKPWPGIPEEKAEREVVTISHTVRPYMVRPSIIVRPCGDCKPRQSGNLLSRDERRRWQKACKSWNLGPDKSKKKQVRFADKVDYEPEQDYAESASDEAQVVPVAVPNFALFVDLMNVIIRIFVILFLALGIWLLLQRIFIEIFGRTIPGAWIDANELPHDIASRVRMSGAASGRPRILEFEAARWSDVDAAVFG